MTITVRFAPSPTGRIHIGNARTAILNWLFARKSGGRFILRYDDTDAERSTTEFADGIATDLDWLGLTPDDVYRQSERFALYDAAAEKLKNDAANMKNRTESSDIGMKTRDGIVQGLAWLSEEFGKLAEQFAPAEKSPEDVGDAPAEKADADAE